jgi:hypothetical protein
VEARGAGEALDDGFANGDDALHAAASAINIDPNTMAAPDFRRRPSDMALLHHPPGVRAIRVSAPVSESVTRPDLRLSRSDGRAGG